MLATLSMPIVQVKKVVAVCFLEAAKLTLEHLGAHRLELSQQGVTGTADLPRIYGELRRLRDFLQRCVSSYQETVDLDLSPADTGLLVACGRRAVEAIELRLVDQAMMPDERQWLQKKRQVLSDWLVELAVKPLVDLPLGRLSPMVTEGVRALTVRLQNKVFGDVRERPKIVVPNSATGGAPSIAHGIASPIGNDVPPPPVAKAEPSAPSALVDATVDDEPSLFDHNRMHDPRLRTLAGVDLASYDRAVHAADFRIATVLLTAILESALLDHALQRRGELGLHGSPETWNLQELLLLKVMGDQAQPKDTALAYHLFASRNLLRPALQIVTPIVVTEASFGRLREFACRALHCLGFGQPRATLPPGVLKASDFQAPGTSG